MSKRDYYEVLGVAKNADETAIKGAYCRLARQYHPDVNKEHDAEERFKEINEAYEVLSDADRRAAYDRYGHAGAQGSRAGPAVLARVAFKTSTIFLATCSAASADWQRGTRRGPGARRGSALRPGDQFPGGRFRRGEGNRDPAA